MDLYFLNFKSILVILSKPEMRLSLLDTLKEQKIDVNVKFVDSYSEAASLIVKNKFNPYDHLIMSLSYSNRKFNDFVEFVLPMNEENPNFLIEYLDNGELSFVEVSSDS